MGCEMGRIRPTNVFERAGESRMTPPASSISSQVRPATGTAPLGMPGPAGGGHLAAAAGPMDGGPRPDGGFNGGGLLRMGLGGGDVLTGSDVALGRETGHGGLLSFWSRGAQSRFAGREGALSLGGDVRTTMVGADYATGPLVTGLSLSHSRGLVPSSGPGGERVLPLQVHHRSWSSRPEPSRAGE